MHVRGRFCQLANSSVCSSSAHSGHQAAASEKRAKLAASSILPMLDKFHDIIGGIHVPVDDGVDKLNRKYTLLVFLFLALPIFTKQYIGDPIECFAPVYFAEHQSRYINSYCWTQSTYYMVPIGDPEDDGDQQEPPDRIMPDEVDYFIGFETVTHIGNERLRRVRVSYYQWAPLILLVQGLCFYIPFLIWNSCANNAGVKLRRLLKKASDIASLPPGCQQREALLAEFVDQFHTLVTGEAGWCADLQCGVNGGGGGNGGSGGGNGGNGSPGNSSASSQASSIVPPLANGDGRGQAGRQQHGRNAGAAGGNQAASAGGNQQNQDQSSHHHRGGGGDRSSDHHNNNNPTGCCLVGIPIIGSLLACCLKPCSSFGLVGPSKYLCLLYLAVKSAYVFNVGLQFFLLGQFLGRGYLKHGLELINRLIVNGDWWASPRFPLSTLCQVRADMSGGLRSYTCQCVLPINVFNEKIFSVVWFYMAFLMPLNVLSLLFWIYRTFETNRLSYIRLCLWRTRLVELNQIHRTVRKLSQSYLGWDGVFLLRLIEHNHGSIMATLIMSRLWEFYANQMKLQEDANQLALANNAQRTLSNTTTAISNQHQLLAAAAAAAAAASQPPPPPSIGAGGGHGNHGGVHHGGNHGGHHGHSHGPLAPLMPTQVGPPPLQQQLGGGGGNHFGHAHGPHSHNHGGGGHGGPASGSFMPQQQQGGPNQQPPMVPHGPHAHHSGQISQQPGHHPLHAANAHHTHHGPTSAAAAASHGPITSVLGPNSAFASGTMSANILAQLQHQHHQHHQQGGGPGGGGGGGVISTGPIGGQNNTTSVVNQQQQQQPTPQQQQPASGNVAAAVAALAAAAAASNNSTSGSAPGLNSTSNTTTTSGNTNSNSTTSGTNQQQQANSSAITATSTTSSTSNNNNTTTNTNNQPPNNSSNNNNSINLHASQALAAIQSVAGRGAAPPTSVGGGPPAPPPPPPPSLATATTSTTGGSGTAGATPNSTQAISSSSGQQQQQHHHHHHHQTSTTSFINAAAGSAAPGTAGGPPLPPPPPAHVVAAVAAASTGSVGLAPQSTTTALVGGGGISSISAQAAAAASLLAAAAAAGGPVSGSTAPGMARTNPAPSNCLTTTTTPNRSQQQQTTTNPVLFNLKSSSGLQAAPVAPSSAVNNGTQANTATSTNAATTTNRGAYNAHTIKRT